MEKTPQIKGNNREYFNNNNVGNIDFPNKDNQQQIQQELIRTELSSSIGTFSLSNTQKSVKCYVCKNSFESSKVGEHIKICKSKKKDSGVKKMSNNESGFSINKLNTFLFILHYFLI